MAKRILLKPYSVNGTGIRLLDYRRVSPDTYEATRWLTLFFIPLIPIGTWLISPGTAEGQGTGTVFNFQILETRPLPWKRVGRMYGMTLLAALPVTLCALFETPGENTNMWVALFGMSVVWFIAVMVFTLHSRRPVYRAPATQPMPTGGTGPRRAA